MYIYIYIYIYNPGLLLLPLLYNINCMHRYGQVLAVRRGRRVGAPALDVLVELVRAPVAYHTMSLWRYHVIPYHASRKLSRYSSYVFTYHTNTMTP